MSDLFCLYMPIWHNICGDFMSLLQGFWLRYCIEELRRYLQHEDRKLMQKRKPELNPLPYRSPVGAEVNLMKPAVLV